jgi:hypothetical protein
MSSALIVFAKIPRPGTVKTRLTPVLTSAEAARLYDAFLRDALAQYQALDADVRLYLSPPFSEAEQAFVPEGVTVHEQVGDGLGARMCNAFAETLAGAYDRACVIGTDHPTLPSAFIRQAFRSLEAPQSLCIGPSDDGGYYLLGMHGFYPQVFADMTYSHPRVFADTLARTDRTEARLTVLPRWYDVDTPAMLRRMLDDLDDAPVAATHTRQAIDDLALHTLRGA